MCCISSGNCETILLTKKEMSPTRSDSSLCTLFFSISSVGFFLRLERAVLLEFPKLSRSMTIRAKASLNKTKTRNHCQSHQLRLRHVNQSRGKRKICCRQTAVANLLDILLNYIKAWQDYHSRSVIFKYVSKGLKNPLYSSQLLRKMDIVLKLIATHWSKAKQLPSYWNSASIYLCRVPASFIGAFLILTAFLI